MTEWWLVATATFLIGGVVMLLWVSITNSRKYHDKRHTHHSELMCDHCTDRAYKSGISLAEARRRWPLRIMGDRPPRGEG